MPRAYGREVPLQHVYRTQIAGDEHEEDCQQRRDDGAADVDARTVRAALHDTRTRQTGRQTGDLAFDQQAFFFGQAINLVAIAHLLKAFQFLDTLEHGRPVCEHTAHPALGNVRHTAASGFLSHSFLCLAFGTNKQNNTGYEFTQREIREALQVKKTALSYYINELMSLEYVQQTSSHINKGNRYRVLHFDNYRKMREDVKAYLQKQIDELKEEEQSVWVGNGSVLVR